MPKKPMDYSKTIIYKLVCKDLNIKECYVGHTTDFKSRKRRHKQSVEDMNCNSYNLKKSKFIRDNGGWDNWDMIEIEKYNCNDAQEARARERYWYETLGAGLNMCVPYRSKTEFYENNKEHILEYQKEYYELNKEQILEKKKQYREEKKEQIQKHKKEYYEENKDKIQAHYSTKCVCECGAITTIYHKSRHLKSLKHCEFIQNNI
jgi:hypothetical protein